MFRCGGVQCPGIIALSFAVVFVCLCLFWCSFPVCSSGVLCCGVSSCIVCCIVLLAGYLGKYVVAFWMVC